MYSGFRGTHPFVSIVIAILIIGFISGLGYVFVRFHNVPTSIDLTHAYDFASLDPTTCTLAGSDFNGSISGNIYIANGNFRADYTSYTQGKEYTYHLVVLSTTGYAYWSDQGNSAPVVIPVISPGTAKCVPWWWPDNSIFTVPSGIPLRPYSSPL